MKKRKYLASALFLVLLFLITYWWLFRGYDIQQCFDVIGDVNIWWALPAVALAFAYVAGEAACIRTSLTAFGTRFSVVKSLQYAAIGFYFSSITPSASGGQPVQIYYMSNDGVPLSGTAMAMMLMSVIFKAVLLFVGLPLVLINSSLVFTGLPRFNVLFILGVCINIFMALLLLSAMFSKSMIYRAVRFVIRLLCRLRIVKNGEKMEETALGHIKSYREAARFIRENPSLSVKLFAITLVQRAAMFSVAYCIYRAFGMKGLSWLDVVTIQVASSFAVDQLPFPGAMGISEGVFLGLYGSIYGAKYLVPALVLTRGCTYYLPMVITGITSGYFHLNHVGRLDRLKRKVAEKRK